MRGKSYQSHGEKGSNIACYQLSRYEASSAVLLPVGSFDRHLYRGRAHIHQAQQTPNTAALHLPRQFSTDAPPCQSRGGEGEYHCTLYSMIVDSMQNYQGYQLRITVVGVLVALPETGDHPLATLLS